MLDLILSLLWIALAVFLGIVLIRGVVLCFVSLAKERNVKAFAFNFLLKGVTVVIYYFLIRRMHLEDSWATIVAYFQP